MNLTDEQTAALNEAIGELLHVDSHMGSERAPAAKRLSLAFGIEWPPPVPEGYEHEDE